MKLTIAHPWKAFDPALLLILLLTQSLYGQSKDYPIHPVDFTQVQLKDGFWKDRVATASKVTIPYAFKKCEETGRIDNFRFAGGLALGKFQGRYGFDDSDVFKILEGAAYSLMTDPDPELRAYVDTVVSYIRAAQEADGYLYTAWSLKANDYADLACCSYAEEGRYIASKFSHELYNAGHMYEAAVSHYQATGTRFFLDVATRNADLVYRICIDQGQLFYPGHQEIEIGLVKLYRATGNEKYLQLAKEFLDRRGKGYRNYGVENSLQGLDFDAYSQDHVPVIEQTEAVGHSVRAGYMYAAMADIAAITGDKAYLVAIDRIWDDIVSKKMYVTGGLGAGHGIEGFDVAYALPNDAYAETCAAIANVYWNHRMFLLHGDSKYIDVLERSLYNGLIAGLSLEGDKFFYPNPLVFDGESNFNQGANCRSDWFNCSCCPSNLSRFVPSVAGYTYALDAGQVYINLFMNNSTTLVVNGSKLEMEQKTNYPWSGEVSISFQNESPVNSNLMIRIPGWVSDQPVPSDLYRFRDQAKASTTITVNGSRIDFKIDKGYAVLPGNWKKGDEITINLPMEVRTIVSHDLVMANTGKIAIQRGPLVYCAEAVDNEGHVLDLTAIDGKSFTATFDPSLLRGVTVLQGKGKVKEGGRKIDVRLIPYYSWSHRDIGPMAVWLGE
ncbi:MAG: glycoside hydrolase family 127 protein [Saprospiraceae bacterium]|nr:glycoside hydrolase family 127 protein [Saprospiraceae bacterium]